MELGLFLNTHGVTNRDGVDWWHQAMSPDQMKPVESALLAEQLGFHSVWMGDHVALPEESPASVSPVPGERKRHYPPRPNILDGAVVMGAIASATSRIKMGPSVLISPYRHPLSDARQFASVDFLSNGRTILGVGAGWIKEEFEALGHDYHSQRGQVLEECIQIYDQAWTKGLVTFHGRFYSFDNMGVFPLPARKPRPPIVIGANSKGSARLVARYAEGLMPLLTVAAANPQWSRDLQDEVSREAERIGRDRREIAMLALTSFRLSRNDEAEARRRPRWNLGGTPDQILSDLERYADAGYCFLIMAPCCPSGSYAEFSEQSEWLGREVLPEAKKIKSKGEWRQSL